MTFNKFSQFLKQVEETSSRNEITVMLAAFLKELNKDEIKETMYLIQGRLVPKYIPLEFNVSRKLLLRAMVQYCGNETEVKELFAQKGDVGLVAEELTGNGNKNSSDGISILSVYQKLKEIALFEGKGSIEFKVNGIVELLKQLDPLSARYAIRMIAGELRLGISEKTILDSLSWALKGDKSLRKLLDVAYGSESNIGTLTERLITSESKDVEDYLQTISIKVGTPVASKLVERESSPETVWERMPNCFVQPKLDGLRGQIHYKKGGFNDIKVEKREGEDAVKAVGQQDLIIEATSLETEVRIFSRNMESMTDQFPELINSVKKLGVDSIILDSEIIGFNPKTGKYFTYQETMQRKRKYDIDQFASDFPVKAMCFDILYLNGEDISKKSIEERLEILRQILKSESGMEEEDLKDASTLEMLETKQMQNVEELSDYFFSQINIGLEGIITKEPGSIYEPGTRNYKWIKLKANTQSNMVDTMDVVVLGYYIGRGQRAKFGIGALLAGVYDPKEEKYYSIGKVGTGITDEQFEIVVNDLKKIKLDESKLKESNGVPANYVVEKMLYPDVWVEPSIVMEIIADEITRSPAHTAARGIEAKVKNDKPEKGLSIRFPRLKIWNRPDRDYPNTVEEIVRMYELRKGEKKDTKE